MSQMAAAALDTMFVCEVGTQREKQCSYHVWEYNVPFYIMYFTNESLLQVAQGLWETGFLSL